MPEKGKKSNLIVGAVRKLLRELGVFVRLFQKEGVFRYLLIIVGLMIVAGVLFMYLEHDRVLAANPNTPNMSLYDKIVTVFYWAIVTIATCGYGDITPGTSGGRIMTIVVLYLSVASVSLFTANLASALTTKKLMERRGIMDITEISEHFIICGWKEGMARMLSDIVYRNPRLNLKKIIIIANVEPDVIEVFKQQYPQYADITILRGEHFNEALLRKANVAGAHKVLILADESANASPTEVDSKTIMAAMTLRAISPSVRICAELLDAKFESYLQSAHVEEIIFTNEYSHSLIASSFAKIGLAKVVNDILDIKAGAFITTEDIPDDYFGKKFAELRDHYKKTEKSILVGLVENVGNYIDRKNDALREAQKTADITKLISNLKNAKHMENNFPNINPDDEYVIPKNSIAILMGNSEARHG